MSSLTVRPYELLRPSVGDHIALLPRLPSTGLRGHESSLSLRHPRSPHSLLPRLRPVRFGAMWPTLLPGGALRATELGPWTA